MHRVFKETEREARLRAESDWLTRDRIAYAHDHIGEAHGHRPALVRKIVREGVLLTEAQIHRSGLTLGEAAAAGIKVEGACGCHG